MNKEDKELLFKDLSARLPYGVKAKIIGHNNPLQVFGVSKLQKSTWAWKKGTYVVCFWNDTKSIDYIRPYLRSMSSMTGEEEKKYREIFVKSQDCSFENSESATAVVNDWLLSNHFDIRGLIKKGLALEAPEGMYKTE